MGRLAEGKSVQEKYGGPLQQVRHWHKAMARAAVAAGRRPGELGKIFGVSAGQMSKILASPLFIAEVERLEAMAELETVDMRTELQLRQPRALQILDETLAAKESEDLPLQRSEDVALEILDRTGYGKNPSVQKHLHLHKHGEVEQMSDEELDRRIENLLDERGFVGEERKEAAQDLLPMILEGEVVSKGS